MKEAKDELAAPHTQSTVDEATEHLNAAIKALVKAETKEETKTDVTKLNAVIEKAEALKQSDYTAESWKNLQIYAVFYLIPQFAADRLSGVSDQKNDP